MPNYNHVKHRLNYQTFYDFWLLTKPRVIALVMLTALIGAALASLHYNRTSLSPLLALLGIALVASSATAFNCLVERFIDSIMKRTRHRPLPMGRVTYPQAIIFIFILGAGGIYLTTFFGGLLTGVLAVASFFGYAIIYTLYLKQATPQNIVIGGASGAMPPLLGWVAVSQQISFEPLLLFLIIFVWTPPHFWALALYRQDDYTKAKIPMLPVTHGKRFTANQIMFYGIILFVVTLLPFLSNMSGVFYVLTAITLNVYFLYLSYLLRQSLDDKIGRQLFSYSITYLGLIFTALLVDRLLWVLLS